MVVVNKPTAFQYGSKRAGILSVPNLGVYTFWPFGVVGFQQTVQQLRVCIAHNRPADNHVSARQKPGQGQANLHLPIAHAHPNNGINIFGDDVERAQISGFKTDPEIVRRLKILESVAGLQKCIDGTFIIGT